MARSFLKSIKSHASFYGCDICCQIGSRFAFNTVYTTSAKELRCDESFRSRKDPNHHHDIASNLELIPELDFVFGFPCDYMHAVCLGVVKRFIAELFDRNCKYRLKKSEIKAINKNIKIISRQLPPVFA